MGFDKFATDEEYMKWMLEQEDSDGESEEIEVDGTDPDVEEYEDEEYDDSEQYEDEEQDEQEDDLEQPEEDSDDNGEDDKATEEVAKDSTEEEEGTDGDPVDTDVEQPDVAEAEVKSETQAVGPVKHRFKANGEEFEFTEDEMKEQFAGIFSRAMDYTKKTQAISKHRKLIDAMEQENLTPEDMNFAIDLLKGNKEAITTLIKKNNIDTLELEVDDTSGYIPNNYGRSNIELDIQEITNEIKYDPEYEVTHRVLTQDWDEESWGEMASKPNLIKLLHTDVKSGVFQQISPIAKKLRMQDELRYGKGMRSDLEYYKAAVGVYGENTQRAALEARQRDEAETNRRKIAEVKAEQERREATKSVAKKRKAAAPTKGNAGRKAPVNYLDEALTMSDTEYLKWMQNKL